LDVWQEREIQLLKEEIHLASYKDLEPGRRLAAPAPNKAVQPELGEDISRAGGPQHKPVPAPVPAPDRLEIQEIDLDEGIGRARAGAGRGSGLELEIDQQPAGHEDGQADPGPLHKQAEPDNKALEMDRAVGPHNNPAVQPDRQQVEDHL
jgi:hypothetical protein